MNSFLAIVPAVLGMVTGLILLLNLRWRWLIIVLTVQYVAVFWLVVQNWSLGLSAVKLLVGWMVGALLASSYNDESSISPFMANLTENIFKIVSSILIILLAFSVSNLSLEWIPASFPVLFGGLVLIGLGLLQLGMSTQPFRLILGLLTVLGGFDIIYASMGSSVLVTGLSAVISLGLALSGAYLMNVENLEETP